MLNTQNRYSKAEDTARYPVTSLASSFGKRQLWLRRLHVYDVWVQKLVIGSAV